MIDVTDALRAIKEVLQLNFPDISVENSDLKNPLRPSFYINVVNQINNRQDSGFIRNLYSFDVIYFGSSQYKGYLDLMEKQAALSNIFINPLVTQKDDRTLYFDVSQLNFNPNTDDYVLNTLFDIEYIQLIDNPFDINDNNEDMEELQVN